MEAYLATLAQCALFAGIEVEQMPALLRRLRAYRQRYGKAATIRQEGDRANFIGLVLEGTVQIVQDDYSGNRNIIASLGAGAMFGEAFACAGVLELPVSILAMTSCTILFLDVGEILTPATAGEDLRQKIIGNLLKIVAEKNTVLNQKLRIVSHKTTAEKLLAFLNEQARLHHALAFTIPYDRQQLADYLGVERSALSAEISKLQRAGILETKRSWFRLLRAK